MRRVLLAAAAVLVAACGPASVPQPPAATPPASTSPLTQVHDPGQVTGHLVGPCHTRAGGQLPDPNCTPGSYDPAIDAHVLCGGGYTTSSYRPPSSQTSRAKHAVVEPAYGMTGAVGELDHLISLELGGSNDLSNLWLEAGPIPNPKDSVEAKLHTWVCHGGPGVAQGRLTQAQSAIADNWMTAEQVLGISSLAARATVSSSKSLTCDNAIVFCITAGQYPGQRPVVVMLPGGLPRVPVPAPSAKCHAPAKRDPHLASRS